MINQEWHVLKTWSFVLFGDQFVGIDLDTDDYTSEQPAPKLESKLDTVVAPEIAKEFKGAVNYFDKEGVIG